jgi:hypothetical protein
MLNPALMQGEKIKEVGGGQIDRHEAAINIDIRQAELTKHLRLLHAARADPHRQQRSAGW